MCGDSFKGTNFCSYRHLIVINVPHEPGLAPGKPQESEPVVTLNENAHPFQSQQLLKKKLKETKTLFGQIGPVIK